jgi:DNA-binding transcriptional MerR regulator
MSNGNYTIGEFSRVMGLSPRTIDFYTRQGLLHPEQFSPGHGYRRYTDQDGQRVALIKQLQTRKFSLQEIREILETGTNPKTVSNLEAMEQIALDLERLKNMVLESHGADKTANTPAMRAVATGALQKATALCSLLINLIQEMPVH